MASSSQTHADESDAFGFDLPDQAEPNASTTTGGQRQKQAHKITASCQIGRTTSVFYIADSNTDLPSDATQ